MEIQTEARTAFRVGDKIADAQFSREVRAIPIEMLMQEQQVSRIDLLKMDVEGAESEIFAHSSGWIDRVRAIAVDIHDWLVPDCGRKVRAGARDFCFELQKAMLRILTRTKHELSLDSKTDLQRRTDSTRSNRAETRADRVANGSEEYFGDTGFSGNTSENWRSSPTKFHLDVLFECISQGALGRKS